MMTPIVLSILMKHLKVFFNFILAYLLILTLINIKINILDNRGLVDQPVLNLQDGRPKPKNKKDIRGIAKNDDEGKRFKGIFLAPAIYLFPALVFILCYIININVLCPLAKRNKGKKPIRYTDNELDFETSNGNL